MENLTGKVIVNQSTISTAEDFRGFNSWLDLDSYYTFYVLSINILVGIIVNFAILTIFSRDRPGVSLNLRLYYVSFAIFHILHLLFGELPRGFLIDGLLFMAHQFNLQGNFTFLNIPGNSPICKLLLIIQFFFLRTINWLYFMFNIERFIAIKKAFWSKLYFTPARSLLYIIILTAIGVIFYLLFSIITPETLMESVEPFSCVVDNPSGFVLSDVIRLIMFFDCLVIPLTLSMIFSLLLINSLKILHIKHLKLINPLHSNGENNQIRSTNNALPGAILALAMILLNVLISLPVAIFGPVECLIPDPSEWLQMLFRLSLSFAALGSIPDFCLYLLRIHSFRRSICFCLDHEYHGSGLARTNSALKPTTDSFYE